MFAIRHLVFVLCVGHTYQVFETAQTALQLHQRGKNFGVLLEAQSATDHTRSTVRTRIEPDRTRLPTQKRSGAFYLRGY